MSKVDLGRTPKVEESTLDTKMNKMRNIINRINKQKYTNKTWHPKKERQYPELPFLFFPPPPSSIGKSASQNGIPFPGILFPSRSFSLFCLEKKRRKCADFGNPRG